MSPIIGARGGLSASAYGLFSVAAATTSFESIATSSVGSGGTASVSFSSIPGTYKHLQLRAMHRITTSASGSRRCILQINGDGTASNYRNHWLYGNGSSATSETDGTNPIIAYSTDAANLSNTFAITIIDILDYSSSNKRKTVRSFNGQDVNGSGGLVGLYSMANYNSISAITSLTFRPNTGSDNLAQYSHFALYGIKG
jgi:hypothetical protein